MGNKNRGESTVRLDRVRVLRFDFNALAEFEDLMGVSFLAALQDFRKDESGDVNVSFKTFRAMLWAGLLHEDPKLTIRGAGELFEMADGDSMIDKMGNVLPQIAEAFIERLGTEGAKKKIQEINSQYRDELTGENSKTQPTELSA